MVGVGGEEVSEVEGLVDKKIYQFNLQGSFPRSLLDMLP
jgi:hypothetical protein